MTNKDLKNFVFGGFNIVHIFQFLASVGALIWLISGFKADIVNKISDHEKRITRTELIQEKILEKLDHIEKCADSTHFYLMFLNKQKQ